MQKSLADLKRALSLGTQVTLIKAPFEHRNLNIPRYVVKTQGNGVYFALNTLSRGQPPQRHRPQRAGPSLPRGSNWSFSIGRAQPVRLVLQT